VSPTSVSEPQNHCLSVHVVQMISKCILDGYKEEQDPRLAGETAKSACRRPKYNQQARPERKGILTCNHDVSFQASTSKHEVHKNWLYMRQASIYSNLVHTLQLLILKHLIKQVSHPQLFTV